MSQFSVLDVLKLCLNTPQPTHIRGRRSAVGAGRPAGRGPRAAARAIHDTRRTRESANPARAPSETETKSCRNFSKVHVVYISNSARKRQRQRSPAKRTRLARGRQRTHPPPAVGESVESSCPDARGNCKKHALARPISTVVPRANARSRLRDTRTAPHLLTC